MSMSTKTTALPTGDFIRFEIRDGSRRLNCVITNDALEAASGLEAASTALLHRRSFDRFRTLIHAAAMMKLHTLPPGSGGEIILNRQDLQKVPSTPGMPVFGKLARMRSIAC